MFFPSSVILCEVGLRDGLQNEKTILTVSEKMTVLEGLIDAGFPVIEVGSFMNPKRVPQMADTDELYRLIGDVPGTELRALIPNLRGAQRAADCGCKKIKLNVSASREHNLRNLNMTPEQSVAGFADCAEFAKQAGMELSGSISMPFASPWEGVTPVEDVDAIIDAYLALDVKEISLSDASGMATPKQVFSLCSHVAEKYPSVTFWMHFHNTRGMAMANICAAMDAGMIRFDTSLGGLGGCPFVPGAAGNISSEDVIHMFDEMGVRTGIDLPKVMDLSRSLVPLLGHPLSSYVLRAGRSCDLIVG